MAATVLLSTPQVCLEITLDILHLGIFIKNIAALRSKSNLENNFRTRISSREEWTANSIFSDYFVLVFTDESKTATCFGSIIFFDASLRFLNRPTVFQTEIHVILPQVDRLAKILNSNIFKSK